MSAGGVLLDTGVLVALYARDDPRHDAATRWLEGCRDQLHTVEPVLVEAAWFLPVRTRVAVAGLAASGMLRIRCVDADGYRRVAALIGKYADRDPDWADIALVWLAETLGVHRIATLDASDFNVYRIHGRKRFELELLA